MTHKTKKRISVVFVLLSYCFGVMLAPIYAIGNDGFDALLSEREGSASTVLTQDKKADVSDFSDVDENDWFYTYLDYLVKNEIVKGKTKTTFEPDSTFSYAECSAVIVRYLGLEREAAQRKEKIDERSPEMKNFWYSGYFEVLGALGIFDGYGLFEMDDEKLLSIDKELANSPILRYRFAESISRSFELDGTICAENVYSEVGGLGKEFVVGGGYDTQVLEMYKPLIKDFEKIPEQSAQYVLKAYYNGIFNGDVSGNFYPFNNLTRGEMAKVLATVMDFSLRTRLVNEGYGCVLDENSMHTDSFGVKTVRYDVWTELLYEEAKNLTVDGNVIKYVRNNKNAPFGYSTDVYLYDVNDGMCTYKTGATLHDTNDTFTYKTANAKILFVLRNLSQNSRPEGVLEVCVTDGVISCALPKVYEMPDLEQTETNNNTYYGTPKTSGVPAFL